jgi:hypothetical protein
LNTVRLDIVVPTARLDLEKLNTIYNLKVPSGMEVSYFFVIDKPEASEIKLEPQMKKKGKINQKRQKSRGSSFKK